MFARSIPFNLISVHYIISLDSSHHPSIHLLSWGYTRTDLRLPFSSNFSRLEKDKNVEKSEFGIYVYSSAKPFSPEDLGTIIFLAFYLLVGFNILVSGVHGRVVDGEHAGRRLRLYGAEDELAGAVGLLAEEKVEEGELVHVVRDLHLAAL